MNDLPEPSLVESPCIKVCVLDAHDICTGCGRALREIADWMRMDPQERRVVRDRAAARLSRRDGFV
jgi:predicted Fe-S protein YdhL (DUF1289 family)